MDGQISAQYGCWPSQADLPMAWLGQPACRYEIHRTVCLCSYDSCNLEVPYWREEQPEGTQVQGAVLILCLIVVVLLVLLVIVVVLYRTCRSNHSQPNLEVGLPSNNRISQWHLLPPTTPAWPPNTPVSSPSLLRAASAPARIMDTKILQY